MNYLIKTSDFSLVWNYLRPSNNSRQLILLINAVVLKVRKPWRDIFTYYLLLITYYLLLITYYLSLITYYLLLIISFITPITAGNSKYTFPVTAVALVVVVVVVVAVYL